MSKFILVHNASNADPILINAKNIAIVVKSELLTGCSNVLLNDMDANFPNVNLHVTETPEQIFEMLK